MLTVQVANHLYGYQNWSDRTLPKYINPVYFKKYSSLFPGRIIETRKANPPTRRGNPAIANFLNQFIIVTGGMKLSIVSEILRSVEYYDIKTNSWRTSPAYLNSGRKGHSMCTLGESMVYVFFGYRYDNN